MLSAPSSVKLPISSLLNVQKTLILLDSSSAKLLREVYTLVKLSILGDTNTSLLIPIYTGFSIL